MQKLLFVTFCLFFCTTNILSMQQQPAKNVRFQTFLPRYTKPTISIFKKAELLLERDAVYQERSKTEQANRQARVQDLADERGITYEQACAQERERRRTQKKIIQDIVEKDQKIQQEILLSEIVATRSLHDQLLIRYTIQNRLNACKKTGENIFATTLIAAATIIACKLNNPDL